jgi:hypothetical protein
MASGEVGGRHGEVGGMQRWGVRCGELRGGVDTSVPLAGQ